MTGEEGEGLLESLTSFLPILERCYWWNTLGTGTLYYALSGGYVSLVLLKEKYFLEIHCQSDVNRSIPGAQSGRYVSLELFQKKLFWNYHFNRNIPFRVSTTQHKGSDMAWLEKHKVKRLQGSQTLDKFLATTKIFVPDLISQWKLVSTEKPYLIPEIWGWISCRNFGFSLSTTISMMYEGL